MSLLDDLGRGREPSPHPKRRDQRRRRRNLAAGATVLVLLLALAGGLTVGVHRVKGWFSSPADYTGVGFGTVIVQVHDGDSATAIAQTLHAKDVVKSTQAFIDTANSHDSEARRISPGYFQLRHHMAASLALKRLLDPAARLQSVVTIPEGFTVDQIIARMVAKTKLAEADLRAALKHADAIGLPAYANGNPEGFLFPATYAFAPDIRPIPAFTQMVQRFNTAAGELNLPAQAKALGRSAYDVVIVASLVEREARVPEDYPKVARVVYNRLKAGMPLQFDSTVNYALHANKTNVSIQDTKVASPYNTYLHTGLPPTPIASPGERALKAALHPSDGTWLYFVTMDDAGHNSFATSYQDFLHLKAQAEKQRSK